MSMPPGSHRSRVRIPADVEREDRILAGLTARQLAILAVPAVVLWVAYEATRRVVPLPVFAALGLPVATAAVVLALGRRGGVGLDRLVLAALRHARSPRRLVPAPEGVPQAPAWAGTDDSPRPAPLRLPVEGLGPEGIVDLGPEGSALISRASTVTFALRTPVEQEALVAAFARLCNALTGPVQILVRAEPVDLSEAVAELLDAAGGLPHPRLEEAAREHARFLADLGAGRDLLRREVLVVVQEPTGFVTKDPEVAAARLRRRAEEAANALAAAGVTLSALDGESGSAVLSHAVAPDRPRASEQAALDAVITGAAP